MSEGSMCGRDNHKKGRKQLTKQRERRLNVWQRQTKARNVEKAEGER